MDDLEFDIPLNITSDLKFGLPFTSNIVKTVPNSSRIKYMHAYGKFMEWGKENNIKDLFSEASLLQYFNKLSQTLRPNSLSCVYSMLSTTISEFHHIEIYNYTQLKSFINKNAAGFQSRKTKVFTPEQLEKFLTEAPDQKYLAVKVAVIFAMSSGRVAQDIIDIKAEDVRQQGDVFLVKPPRTSHRDKSLKGSSFVIRERYTPLVQKYIELRPKNTQIKRFFMAYRDGKCIRHVIGRNSFCLLPKRIATYLNLPEPEQYTGHSFRQTSKKLRSLFGSLQNINLIKSRKRKYLLDTGLEEVTTRTRNAALSEPLHENRQFENDVERIKKEPTHLDNGTLEETTTEDQWHNEAELSSDYENIVSKEKKTQINWDGPSTSKEMNGHRTNDPLANEERAERSLEEERLELDSNSDDEKPLTQIRELPSETLLKTVMQTLTYDRENDKQWLEIERERIRQKDAELQLQGQWLDLMKTGLRVLEKHLDRNRRT